MIGRGKTKTKTKKNKQTKKQNKTKTKLNKTKQNKQTKNKIKQQTNQNKKNTIKTLMLHVCFDTIRFLVNANKLLFKSFSMVSSTNDCASGYICFAS